MTDGLVIRPARPDDLDGVLRIHVEQGSRSDGPSTDRERAMWHRMMTTSDLTVYVAELESELIGTAGVMAMPNVTYDCAPTLFVEAVVVTPPHRRRGIATAIMQRVLDDARAAGCNKVQVLSHKRHASDGAHDLYRNLGFSAEAEGFRLYLTDAGR